MVQHEKQKLREKIWNLMEKEAIARFPLPSRDRIPNFEGAEIAAERLKELPEWKKAKIIIANPDSPQQPARELALREGKVLIMASPRLRQGYWKIKPEKVKGKEKHASTIRGAARLSEKITDLPRPDLIITGCVAVDKNGNRLGKGGGYGDKEIEEIREKFGQIPVVTTIHDAQLVEMVPHEEQDQKVEIIVTPTQVVRVSR